MKKKCSYLMKWWNAYFNTPRTYWIIFGTMGAVFTNFGRAYRHRLKEFNIPEESDSTVTEDGLKWLDRYMYDTAREISKGRYYG